MTISNVPTTLFTGFFGVGKTTAIRSLLVSKDPAETWAVLVNEFGEVPIDQAALEGDEEQDGVVIREIAGGCLCCTMNLPMKVAITEILRRAKPDRLIIEPTGIGHPAGILDELRSPDLAAAIDVRAVICLVDPRVVMDPRLQAAELFRDQVHLADILIANKADLASAEDIVNFKAWGASLFPPKLRVLTATQGDLDPALMDMGADGERAPLFPDLHNHSHDRLATSVPADPKPGKPVRLENAGEGFSACGWVFDPSDVFERDALADFLGPPGPMDKIQRLKGVFCTGAEWLLIDRVGDEISMIPVAYRRDSRIEVIVDAGAGAPDWDKFDTRLMALMNASKGE